MTTEKVYFCVLCNEVVSEELGMKKMGDCPYCKKQSQFFPKPVVDIKKSPIEKIRDYHVWDITYDIKTGQEKNKKLIPPNLGALIYHELDMYFVTIIDNSEIWFFNGSYYEPQGEQKIMDWVERLLNEDTSEYYKKEVVGYIRDKNYQKRTIFDPPINLINMKNGVYDTDTGKLLKHSPKYHFINEIPIDFDISADCPKIKKFFQEVVYKEDVPVIQEFFGYCLYRLYHIHKACMFIGGGKNGKSTALRLLTAFLGINNVLSKELQNIVFDRFATASLYGRLANIAADITGTALKQTGKFKALTGQDLVNAEKKFKNDFDFYNYAKFIFSANFLPKTDDESYAYYRRWILISFPNTFEGDACNKNLIDELTAPNELSGLFNWAIEGLHRLMETGDFSYGKTVEEVMEQYKKLSDPVFAYVKKYLTCEIGKNVTKDELFCHYTKWSKENKLPITPKNILTQELAKHLPDIRPGKTTYSGKRTPAYMNITWKNIEIEKSNLDTFFTEENS
jgi:putative DNA primase/helicase